MSRNPRDFFETFVRPAYEEWRAEPLSIRRATIAACELDNLAERMIVFGAPPEVFEDDRKLLKFVPPRRREMRDRDPAIAACQDIHDNHKHVRLGRDTAIIRMGQTPQKVTRPGPFNPKVFQANAFQTETRQLELELDSGEVRVIHTVLREAFDFWASELEEL